MSEEIMCFGDCNIDIVIPITEIPVKGGCSYSSKMSMNIGGTMINTAFALSVLGLKVSVISKIGNDMFGDKVLDFLKEEGIGTDNIIRSSYPTGVAIALVEDDSEKRWIAIRKNAADRHISTSEIAEIPVPKKLFITGVTLAEGHESRESAIQMTKKVKNDGGMVFLDPNIRIPAWELSSDIRDAFYSILPYVDVLMSNEIETIMLGSDEEPEKAAKNLLTRGVGTVWVKLGDKGCLYATINDTMAFDPVKVKAVDTCGAGDAFNAAIIYGYVNSWLTDQIGRFANRFAAYTVGKQGSTSSLPGKHEIKAMLKEILT